MRALLVILSFLAITDQALATGGLNPGTALLQGYYEPLAKVMGHYKLKEQDKNHPCNFQGPDLVEKYGVRLSAGLETSVDAYAIQKVGDLSVRFETFYELPKIWYKVFDRADFFSVDKGEDTTYLWRDLTTITHWTSWNSNDEYSPSLTHGVKLKVHPFRGTEVGIQHIQFFTKAKEFTYSYYIEAYSGTGSVESSELANRCTFEKTSD